MNRVPALRNGNNYASLKSHQFFHNFDWDDLYHQKLKPPYIPPEGNMICKKEIEAGLAANQSVDKVIEKNTNKEDQLFLKQNSGKIDWDANF